MWEFSAKTYVSLSISLMEMTKSKGQRAFPLGTPEVHIHFQRSYQLTKIEIAITLNKISFS